MVWLCGVDGFREKWRAVLGNFDAGEVRLFDLPLEGILRSLRGTSDYRRRRANWTAGSHTTRWSDL